MAEIAPFRGILYTAKAGAPEKLLAPPYDVISRRGARAAGGARSAQLRAAHPARGRRRREVRQRPRAICNEWLRRRHPGARRRAGALSLPPDLHGRGQTATRRGFICRIRLARFEERIVLPHERTLAGPKADRLKLKRATRAHLSQVFGLYSDPERKSDEPFVELETTAPALAGHDQRRRRAEAVAADRQGGAGARWWRSSAHEKIYIADGHHRYETMLALRDELRAESAQQPALVGGVRHDLPGQHGRPGPARVPHASRGARAAVVRSAQSVLERARAVLRGHAMAAGDAAGGARRARAARPWRGRRSRSLPATGRSTTCRCGATCSLDDVAVAAGARRCCARST